MDGTTQFLKNRQTYFFAAVLLLQQIANYDLTIVYHVMIFTFFLNLFYLLCYKVYFLLCKNFATLITRSCLWHQFIKFFPAILAARDFK